MGDMGMIAGGLALVIALAMPDLRRCRMAAVLAMALILAGAIAQGLWIVAGIAGAGLLVSAAPLVVQMLRAGMVRFSPDEAVMKDRYLTGLDAMAARALLDQGHWLTARAGETLTREGEAVASLFFLAGGEARVMRAGQLVGRIGAGELIGEAGALDDATATATVVLESNSRLWFMLAPALRDYVAVHSGVGLALRKSFAAALRGKLEESNRALAGRTD
jgi:hypothetical protein